MLSLPSYVDALRQTICLHRLVNYFLLIHGLGVLVDLFILVLMVSLPIHWHLHVSNVYGLPSLPISGPGQSRRSNALVS